LIPGLVTRDPRFAKPLSLSLSRLFLGLKFLDGLTVCEELGLDAVECGFGLLPGLAVGHETSLGFGAMKRKGRTTLPGPSNALPHCQYIRGQWGGPFNHAACRLQADILPDLASRSRS
jgi:hypothetical protein